MGGVDVGDGGKSKGPSRKLYAGMAKKYSYGNTLSIPLQRGAVIAASKQRVQ